jgi:hypothetical protein
MVGRLFGTEKRHRSSRTWRRLKVGTLVLTVGLAASAVALFAVHDTGIFELDGNVVTDGAPPQHDWDKVYSDSLTGLNTAGATASSFTAEANPSASIFTGGGSKDPTDLNQWLWKDAGGLPDKDNLVDAFAARYSLPVSTHCPAPAGSTTCEVLYFGSDRFDNSGDAQQGFWFLQNPVGIRYDSNGDGEPDTNCPASGGSSFTFCNPNDGTAVKHEDGDLLVISDFSNGGTVSTINVYQWSTATNGLVGVTGSTSALCSPSRADGDGFCGIVNPTNGTVTTWPYTDKSGNHTYLQGELYEGGVNLSALGFGDECFSSVVAETRSSTSTTATLKDFVVGSFASCQSGLTTTPSVGAGGVVSRGSPVTDIATVTVGSPGNPTPTGTVSFFLCGPIPSGVCASDGTPIGSGSLADKEGDATHGDATATSPQVNTSGSPLAPGRYCFRAEWPGDSNYPGAQIHAGEGNSECFVVRDSTATVTNQNWLPNDSATVTAVGSSNLSGSVNFKLYDTIGCTGTVKYEETIPLNNVASGTTVTTSNTTVKVTATGDFSWKVVFTSTNDNVVGSNASCETTSLTIDNHQ